MLPVVTPEEMAAVDAAAPEPVEVLVGRAGAATAREALRLLGGTYGRRVLVVAGKGNNGADGRDAAARLARRGVRVQVVPAGEPVPSGPASRPHLVIDAAYGTGFRGTYEAPAIPGVGGAGADAGADFGAGSGDGPGTGAVPVLAVDIPSGVSGLTGAVSGSPLPARRTVTFAALKPGLLFPPGRELAGDVVLADIGLDVSGARIGLVQRADVAAWVPSRPVAAHKWQAAVVLVAGSPGMTGAAHLAARAAQRAGAGMVRVATPGLAVDPGLPTEAVGVPGVDVDQWEQAVAAQLDRAGALVVGPGLGTAAGVAERLRRLVTTAAGTPLLVDGDGLTALGKEAPDALAGRAVPAVLTPHDGEFARLAGAPPGDDRIAAARSLAAQVGAVVLLKGPTTVVAHPDGRARLSTEGDARLATAGTGDVLSGCIGALLARGLDPFDAAAAGAWLHGRAARHGDAEGLVASDVVDLLPLALADLREAAGPDRGRRAVTELPELREDL
ncbi:MAG TPA: NAD(P)H-hydrate dehydratase [Acidimicrobiales bacterium]